MKNSLLILLLLYSFTVRVPQNHDDKYNLLNDANFSKGTTGIKSGKYLLSIPKETGTSFAYLIP
ncbi:MAG: hypothetical protein ACK4HE_05030 [Chitinophagaceae bacterium]